MNVDQRRIHKVNLNKYDESQREEVRVFALPEVIFNDIALNATSTHLHDVLNIDNH